MKQAENREIALSVVVAAWNGAGSLGKCLESLKRQTDLHATEIIVAANFAVSAGTADGPVEFLKLNDAATVPDLRRAGIERARGRIVALVEDLCFFDRQWCAEIKKAHASDFSVIGGAVENASGEKALDWAVYFYDYGKYMSPNEAGAVEALSGVNVSYKREALSQVEETYRDGFYETFVNEELKKRGHRLAMSPAAIVYHHKEYAAKRAAEHCYYLARSFAARRVAGTGLLYRGRFVAASLLLPFLLPARIVATTVKKGRHYSQLMRSFPFLAFLMCVWSFGEFAGYLRGEGNSAAEWR